MAALNGNPGDGDGVVAGAGESTGESAEDLSDYTDADESISAPTEILAEFLSAVMLKDYDAALKHCKMILQYEPNHSTAKEFYPLILEKIIQASAEAEAETEDAEPEEESDSEDESSNDNGESSNSNSEAEGSASESADEEGEEEEEVAEGKGTTDSDATTASYSSLEDEEADNGVNLAPADHSKKDDNAFVSEANNNPSDSESPTEPVSQAQLVARLRSQVISGRL